MWWTITKTFRFEASHVLPYHSGKCSRLHGHSWLMAVALKGSPAQDDAGRSDSGMVFDFARLKQVVQPIVDQYLDHYHLNDSTGLTNPTSENLAEWAYGMIDKAFLSAGLDVNLHSVTIEETCTSACTYTRPIV